MRSLLAYNDSTQPTFSSQSPRRSYGEAYRCLSAIESLRRPARQREASAEADGVRRASNLVAPNIFSVTSSPFPGSLHRNPELFCQHSQLRIKGCRTYPTLLNSVLSHLGHGGRVSSSSSSVTSCPQFLHLYVPLPGFSPVVGTADLLS